MKPIAITASVLLCAALLLTATQSHAWTRNFARCNGADVKWRGDVNIHRNSYSIPSTGDKNSAYWNGISQWNNYANFFQSGDYFTNSTSDRSWDRATNGQNEVSIAERRYIDGADGRTFVAIGACGVGSNDIDEADVVIASDLSFWPGWGTDIGSESGNRGRTAFVHEMGHFMGFGHSSWAWTQMNTSGTGTLTGSHEPAAAFPDDALGMRAFYGARYDLPNIIASANQLSSGVVRNIDPGGVFTVCRNTQQVSRFYLGNAGNVSTGSFSVRVRMSAVSPSSGGYTQSTTRVVSGTQSRSAASEGITDFIFTVPRSLPNGDYYIYIDADPDNAIGEVRENDNYTLSATVLRLTSAC